MPEATFYTEGAFCWSDCATTDLEASTKFYTGVFDLEHTDTPIPGGVYVQFQRQGKNVAGAYVQLEEERAQGIPPHWNTYIAVEDADAATEKAEGLGASVLAPPFDVLTSGRMSVVADPTGAAIGLWQAKDHIGAQVYAEENTIGWWELMTPEPKTAVEFYTGMFGYGVQEMSTLTGPYHVLVHKGENAVGIMAPPQPGLPAVWTPYFMVSDAGATAGKAGAMGGVEMMPVTEVPDIGRFGWVTDPQGAVIAFIEPFPRAGA